MRPPNYCLQGTGPLGSICLLMTVQCGIGDDIAALPAVAELAKENAVTVYTIHPELWRGIQVRVIGVKYDGANAVVCDNGETLNIHWDREHLPKYELIYKLSSWAVWEDHDVEGRARPRTKQLADLLDIVLPEEPFDYAHALRCVKRNDAPYTVLSCESREVMRALPEEKAFELYAGLTQLTDVVWLTEFHPTKRRIQCKSLSELVNLIYNCERYVGVDNGASHIATALGKPCLIIGGMTDVRSIFAQYNAPLSIIQTSHSECKSPCYRMPKNGFTNNQCCGRYDAPACMTSLDTDLAVSFAQNASITHSNAKV